MADLSLVGRCGLYCGACGIYRAYRDGGDYLKEVAESFDCSPQLVRCEGCQELTPECWGHNCKIVNCLRGKGFSFCHECSDLKSCPKHSKLHEGYEELGVDIKGNLERIKAGDAEGWVMEQESKWRCKSCGKPISCHMEECHQCGAKLDIIPK
ncbi:MAG: DUF3795 domain-containing protein [Methanobacteriota archaeon]|nr:MAG: DUF3795 domain-containing protein [Euryarchaeota archaeon]